MKNLDLNCIKEFYTKKKSCNAEENKINRKLYTEYQKLANKNLRPWISWNGKGKYYHTTRIQQDIVCVCTEKVEIVDDPDEILLKNNQSHFPVLPTKLIRFKNSFD